MEGDIRMLKRMVSEHQSRLGLLVNMHSCLFQAYILLREEHAHLVEQHNALEEYLLQEGLLSGGLSPVIRREAFSPTSEAPRPRRSCGLMDLLLTAGLSSKLVLSAGAGAACQWLRASRSCMRCLTSAFADLLRTPGSLAACSPTAPPSLAVRAAAQHDAAVGGRRWRWQLCAKGSLVDVCAFPAGRRWLDSASSTVSGGGRVSSSRGSHSPRTPMWGLPRAEEGALTMRLEGFTLERSLGDMLWETFEESEVMGELANLMGIRALLQFRATSRAGRANAELVDLRRLRKLGLERKAEPPRDSQGAPEAWQLSLAHKLVYDLDSESMRHFCITSREVYDWISPVVVALGAQAKVKDAEEEQEEQEEEQVEEQEPEEEQAEERAEKWAEESEEDDEEAELTNALRCPEEEKEEDDTEEDEDEDEKEYEEADEQRWQFQQAPNPQLRPARTGLGLGMRGATRNAPVRLCGLRARTDLNGVIGVLLLPGNPSGRLNVLLADGQSVRVWPENVEYLGAERRRPSTKSCSSTRLPGRTQSLRPLEVSRCLLFAAPFGGRPVQRGLAAASRRLFLAGGGRAQIHVCGGHDGRTAFGTAECLDVASSRWEPVPSALHARHAGSSVVCHGALYVCGGMDSSEASPSSTSTRPSPSFMRGRTRPSSANDRSEVCTRMLGRQPLSSMERYDPWIGAWRLMPPMSLARVQPFVGVIDGFIYVCGGFARRQEYASVERFDVFRHCWQTMAPMSQVRAYPMGAVVRGRLYVCGGRCNEEYLDSSESFDPSTSAWERLPPMADRRSQGAVVHANGILYIFGGWSSAAYMASGESYSISERGAAWQPLPPMQQARCGATAATLPSSGSESRKIFVCGGLGPGAVVAEALDLRTGVWEILQPPIPLGRCGSVTAVAAGCLYICGGHSSTGECSDQVVRLNLGGETWEVLPPMSERRAFAAGGLLMT